MEAKISDGRTLVPHVARRRRRALALTCALAVGAFGCSSSPKSSTPGTTSFPPSTTLGVPTTTTGPPSAAGDLQRYFAAAGRVDTRLKEAADAINGAIGKTTVTVDQSTLDAIDAANPNAAAKQIPPGLTPSLLLPLLTVQSDLVSRYFSLRGFRLNLANPGQPNTFPASDPHVGYARVCLGEGAPAAGAFSADLAAARAAAASAPPVVAAAPSSRAAADLAIRLQHNVLLNEGGAGCGGSRVTTLAPVSWHHVDPLPGETTSWDGDVAALLFTAGYKSGPGWTVVFHGN